MSGLILAAIAGILGGTWLPRRQATRARGAADGEAGLWDAWLDNGHEGEIGLAQEPLTFGEPVRVRPRVYSVEGGEPLPVEDVIAPILVAHDRGAIRVWGPDGSGKSTALDHLARLVPPHLGVSFFDGPDPLTLSVASAGLVVFASPYPGSKTLAELKLAPWGRDEWIEYLLAADRGTCASVMARLAERRAEADRLGGIPDLWTIVLDLMAADESIAGPRQALAIELGRRLVDRDFRQLIEADCLAALVLRGQTTSRRAACLCRHDPDEPLFRMIRHRAVQLLLAADRIGDEIARGEECPALADLLPSDLVQEAALRIAGRPEAVDHLGRLLAGPDEATHPMAASLLHALRIGWTPRPPAPCLKGAYLEEASWAGVVLCDADLRDADLSQSDLRDVRLDRARLGNARLAAADLRAASLREAWFGGANLHCARLVGVHAEDANLQSARLETADLGGAFLDRAILRDADLRGARLSSASLIAADLSGARVDEADFSGADLSGAILRELNLTTARFDGCRFAGADLSRSDLEGLALPEAEFAGANLSHALLTASRMPGANFQGARLRGAGLAEVEWERADLRDADLREAAFHLGSSRSGLVGSPIACEGSRTGFYTDDYNEQDFKSPEEIRKANLVGADLRGAIIKGVDFYLVDLRDARVDPEHVPHLRQCGAILESRA